MKTNLFILIICLSIFLSCKKDTATKSNNNTSHKASYLSLVTGLYNVNAYEEIWGYNNLKPYDTILKRWNQTLTISAIGDSSIAELSDTLQFDSYSSTTDYLVFGKLKGYYEVDLFYYKNNDSIFMQTGTPTNALGGGDNNYYSGKK